MVLRNSGKLKSDVDYVDVYISPNRTYEERQEHKNLVVELKNRIKNNPDTWWTIRNGKVISSGPRQLKGP